MSYRLLAHKIRTSCLTSCCKNNATRVLSSKPAQLPEYPLIYDESPIGKRDQEKEKWYNSIRNLPTIEEKLLESTNNPWEKTVKEVPLDGTKLYPVSLQYDTLPMRQYITRTKLINGLPSNYFGATEDEFYQQVKPYLEEALILSQKADSVPTWEKPLKSKQEEKLRSNRLIDYIFRALHLPLASKFPHLNQSQIDTDARVDSFWLFGGFPPTEDAKKKRKEEDSKLPVDESVEEFVYYSSRPRIQLRTRTPLPPVVNMNDPICNPADVPTFYYVPQALGFQPENQWPVLLPGFWTGDSFECGHTCFHTLEDIQDRRKLIGNWGEDEISKETAILSSFGWLMGLAAFQGYGPYNELKDPLVCQTVLTNGQFWSFSVYQMNTCRLVHNIENNRRCNLCWVSEDMKLYDEIVDGHVKGLNEDVFKLIIQFLSKTPLENPFNKETVKGKEASPDAWQVIVKRLRDRYSQKPLLHRLRKRKAYDWERIYLFNNAFVSCNPNRKRDKTETM